MKKTFRLNGLDCANCAAKIETAVQKIPGVTAASVSFMTTKMTLEAPAEELDRIAEQAAAIVKKVDPDVTIQKG